MPRWPKRTIEERFWSHVRKTDSCWYWQGAHDVGGYGQFMLSATCGHMKTHRLAWEWARGPIPAGMFICHNCDTPACVRPDHLFLGSNRDNMADMRAKGRSLTGDRNTMRQRPECVPRGERQGRSMLTAKQVQEIRQRFANGEQGQSLAQVFGVSRGLIYSIVRHRRWGHVDEAAPPLTRRVWNGSTVRSSKLTESSVVEIRRLYAAGHASLRMLSAQFGVAKSTIAAVVHRHAWQHIP